MFLKLRRRYSSKTMTRLEDRYKNSIIVSLHFLSSKKYPHLPQNPNKFQFPTRFISLILSTSHVLHRKNIHSRAISSVEDFRIYSPYSNTSQNDFIRIQHASQVHFQHTSPFESFDLDVAVKVEFQIPPKYQTSMLF